MSGAPPFADVDDCLTFWVCDVPCVRDREVVLSGRMVLADLRVQPLELAGGRQAFTIVWPEGSVHDEADGFLRQFTHGTQRTYGYLLVDHLRWLERECLALSSVSLRDLERYMGIVGAQVQMPLGEPWRAGKCPYGQDALSAAASCIKGFYLYLASVGVNAELGRRLSRTRLPSAVGAGPCHAVHAC